MDKEIKNLEERLARVESILGNGINEAILGHQEALKELKRVIEGDTSLNVRPVRDEITALSTQTSDGFIAVNQRLDDLERRWDRVKWIGIGLGLLGATNIGAVVSVINILTTTH